MNYKQMLDKMTELEHRIHVLESQRQLEQQAKREAPMIAQPTYPQPPWIVTCQQDPRYQSESLT